MRLFIVDAFTDAPFRGNPAGVVILEREADPAWMQAVAAELKHSETAFALPSAHRTTLRWFTPTTEVDLCGHATLATAHVLGGEQVFHTKSGELRCTATEGRVSMDFPASPPVPLDGQDTPDVSAIERALGTSFDDIGTGGGDLLVTTTAEAVRALDPDLTAVAKWPFRCVMVTAEGDRAGIDFVSRVFGPAVGVPEDPVTGSAHCTLAPYWSNRFGRAELVGEQASARGGIVHMALDGDRVGIGGEARTVVSGELLV
ncbi:PhzF family phenazine biosynthesis protein [Saccharomonospora sp. NPDC006951]